MRPLGDQARNVEFVESGIATFAQHEVVGLGDLLSNWVNGEDETQAQFLERLGNSPAGSFEFTTDVTFSDFFTSNDVLQTVLCIRNAIDPPRDDQKIEATIGFGDSANPFAEPDSFFGTSGIQLFRVNIPVPADPAVPVTGEARTGSESNGWELLLDPDKASPLCMRHDF